MSDNKHISDLDIKASLAADDIIPIYDSATGENKGIKLADLIATLSNKTLNSPIINTPTGIVKGDVGLGNIDNTSDATKNSASATLTNKTLTTPKIDTINEETTNNGVTVDGLSIKDGKLNTNDSVVETNITNDSVTYNKVASGAVIQYVYTNRNTPIDASNQIIPVDDTIPQNTEGVECATQAITPKLASSNLVIEFNGFIYSSLATWITIAIFQDNIANAIGAVSHYMDTATAAVLTPIKLNIPAVNVANRTYKIRVGSNTNTRLTLNGGAGGRWFGDIPKSFISVMEIKA